jgi:HEAT repeat protein
MPTPPKKGKKDSSNQLLERLLNDDDLDDHFAAREALAEVTGAAREAIVDGVVAAATGRLPQTVAIGVLGDLDGPRAVAALVTLAAHRDEEVRAEAVTGLAHLVSHPAEAVPALVRALSDKSEDVRDQAADALAEYASPAAVEPLLAAIAEARRGARWQTDVRVGALLEALAASGPDEARVIDALVEHLDPKAPVVARPAFDALTTLGDKAERARPTLEALVTSGDVWMAIHAHRVLLALGGSPDVHVQAIVEALVVKDPVNAAASALLQELGAVAKPYVEAASKGKDATLRKFADRVRTKMASRR